MSERKYVRVWRRGHYKNTKEIGKNEHPIRKWIKGKFINKEIKFPILFEERGEKQHE